LSAVWAWACVASRAAAASAINEAETRMSILPARE
jgi:hypothetical protein